MGTGTLPDLDVTPAAFDTAHQELLVDPKYDRDDRGNLRTAYPDSAAVSRFVAAWGNRVDDTLRAIQRRFRGEVTVGTFGTPADDPQAALSWVSAAGQVYLRNAANSAFRALRLLRLQLNSGAQILDRAGTPEGNEIAGGGSICLDTTNRTAYVKTTASGNTGWADLRASSMPLVDSFGWSGSNIGAYYIPFASKIVESGTMTTQHLYRCPIAGTLDRVVLLCQNDPGSTDFDVLQADGTTSLASVTGATASTVSWSAASTAYELAFADLGVSVSAGDYVSMLLDVTTGAGEVTGWLEITPS